MWVGVDEGINRDYLLFDEVDEYEIDVLNHFIRNNNRGL